MKAWFENAYVAIYQANHVCIESNEAHSGNSKECIQVFVQYPYLVMSPGVYIPSAEQQRKVGIHVEMKLL